MLKMKTTAPIPNFLRTAAAGSQHFTPPSVPQAPAPVFTQSLSPQSSAVSVPVAQETHTPTLPEVKAIGDLVADLEVIIEPAVNVSPPPAQPAEREHETPASTPSVTGTPTLEIPGLIASVDVAPVTQASGRQNWQLQSEMKDVIKNILETAPAEIVTAVTTTSQFASAVDELAPASVADFDVSQRSIDPVTFPSPCPSSVGGLNLLMTPEPQPVALRASYVADNNIPDGQVFPPGAEFVKSWKMLNDGSRDWPESTQLVWVAGDKLTNQLVMKIGMVQAGEEVDIWTGEMKAPDAPGKYVSYWRLNDGRGNQFGNSLWSDITVAEPQKSDSSEEESLASSSVVMPNAAPQRTSAASANSAPAAAAGTSAATTTSATFSDIGSDDSDLSVVDMPSSPSLDSNDSLEWQEPREQVALSETGVEYVVLYDDSSDDE